ncbi:MAG TPA: hypothetical protein DGX96_04870 [Lachnospiraceae bacterium]|jgi:cell division inhibitor SepF|nr:hypothetical protein [Lachnospiraceae bacterium]
MNVIDKLINSARLNNRNDGDDEEMDEDYYEDDNEEEDDEDRAPRRGGSRISSFFRGRGRQTEEPENDSDYDEQPPAPARTVQRTPSYPSPRQAAAPVPQRQRRPQSGIMQMRVIKPSTFEQAKQITDMLLDHRAVILNLEGLDVNTAQRIVDFASGSCYALHGNFMSVSKFIIAISPEDITIDGDLQETPQPQSSSTASYAQPAAGSAQQQPQQNTFNAADAFTQTYQGSGNAASYGSPYYGN